MDTQGVLDNFNIIKTVRNGFHGLAELAQERDSPQFFVLKIAQDDKRDFLKREFEICKSLEHPSIVKVYGLKTGIYHPKYQTAKEVTYMITEYIPGRELFDLVEVMNGLAEPFAVFYLRQLVKTVKFLEENNIVHRDLKLENILLDSDLNLKLIEFGFSTFVNESEIHKTHLGTPRYSAPEVLSKKPYDPKKSDVFSLGVILFIMVSGIPPFNQAKSCPYYNKYQQRNEKFWQNVETVKERTFSDSLKKLINSMLKHDPAERFSLNDVIESEWFNQEIKEPQILSQISILNQHLQRCKELHVYHRQNSLNRSEDAINLIDLEKINISNVKVKPIECTEILLQGKKGIHVKIEDYNLLLFFVIQICTDIGGEQKDATSDHLNFVFKNDEENVSMKINFYKIDQKTVFIEFYRESGDYFKFHSLKKQIEKGFEKHCTEL